MEESQSLSILAVRHRYGFCVRLTQRRVHHHRCATPSRQLGYGATAA